MSVDSYLFAPQVLQTIVVPGDVSSTQLREGVIALSLAGSEIMGVDEGDDGSVKVVGSLGPTALVVDHDVPSCAGLLHFTDHLILPASIAGAIPAAVPAASVPARVPPPAKAPAASAPVAASPTVAVAPSPAVRPTAAPAATPSAPAPAPVLPVSVPSNASEPQPSSERGSTFPSSVPASQPEVRIELTTALASFRPVRA